MGISTKSCETSIVVNIKGQLASQDPLIKCDKRSFSTVEDKVLPRDRVSRSGIPKLAIRIWLMGFSPSAVIP